VVDIDLNQLKALFDTLKESEISEFEYEDEKVRLRIGRGGPVIATAAPAYVAAAAHAHAPVAAAPAGAAVVDESSVAYVTSPFVGTFYRSPSPDAPPFVNPGSTIREGQTLCIVEAMKLMNEIEADCAGTILDILVENGKPVEFGQKLFKVQRD
jgi:acetyl-CoA carboxylase biotin carboxyl carrier protein